MNAALVQHPAGAAQPGEERKEEAMPDNYPDFFSPLETLPRETMRQLQEARLLATIEQSWERSPLFRSLWSDAGLHPRDIRSIEDFHAKAPCFDKDAIRRYRDRHDDPCGGLVRLDDPRLTSIASTSGTTGDPTPMPMRFRATSQEGYVRDYWHFGARPGDYITIPLFTFRGGAAIGLSYYREAGIIPIYFGHSPQELPRMVEATKRYRPSIFGLISSPLIIAFEQYFERHDMDPKEFFGSYRAAVFGGEALSPRLRRLAASWEIELFETTGLGDLVSGTECKAHDGFHAYEDMALVECLALNSNEPVCDGETGELVVTSLSDPLFAMVRYRTDDLVTLNRTPCRCGRTQVRFHIHGRKSDQIIVQGRRILPSDIRHHVEERHETAAGLFQIIKSQTEMDQLAVRVGYSPAKLRGSTDALAASLAEELGVVFDVPVRIELTPDEELLKLGPPHKIPRVTKR